ncbi:MAG TPA: DUF3782 domain-containing protein [Armatimonadetes bacterium]|nr:DUF3782 domain-containing protein [Armatimonadota bacterium]
MTEEQIIEIVRRHLPRLMDENPEVRQFVLSIVAEYAPSREELMEIIREIRAMREDFNRRFDRYDRILEEHTRVIEEHSRAIEEHSRILQEHSRILQEHTHAIEEHSRILQEHSRVIQEHGRILEEHSRILQEHSKRIERLTEEVGKLGRIVSAIGTRWGMLSEEAFRDAFRAVLGRQLGLEVKKWRYYDEEGFVFGRPDWIEADIAISDAEHLLIEIKASVSRGDILVFQRVGQMYERVTKVRPHLMIVSPFVDEAAKELANSFSIEVRSGA